MRASRIGVCFFMLFLLSCILALSSCQSLERLPQPPGGGQPFSREAPGGPPKPGYGGQSGPAEPPGPPGPPSSKNSMLICANVVNVKPDMLKIVPGQKDIYLVKNATCLVTFSESEVIKLNLVVRMLGDILAFGTLIPLDKSPKKYKMARSIKFEMPGYRPVIFRNIRVSENRLILPDVVFEPAR